jgi:uncharacterized protein YjiS (DUF1127 family)
LLVAARIVAVSEGRSLAFSPLDLKDRMEMHSPRSHYAVHGRAACAQPRLHWGSRLVAALKRLRSAIESERQSRRAALELERLDDRMLRDIGIGRSEIDRVVRGPRDIWRDGQ